MAKPSIGAGKTASGLDLLAVTTSKQDYVNFGMIMVTMTQFLSTINDVLLQTKPDDTQLHSL